MKHVFLATGALLCATLVFATADTIDRAGIIKQIDSPAGAASSAPNLFAAPDGRIYLSWIEKVADNRHRLRFAARNRSGWSEARTIAEGQNWFVNWADFPSIYSPRDGLLATHWRVKNGAGSYAYNVNMSLSTDGGATWSRPFTPHRDNTETEHGFVSMFASPGKRVGAIWLDGRNFASRAKDHSHGHGPSKEEMTLRYAEIGADGKLSKEAVLDGRVCECCQTSAAETSEGAVVVYRDRSEKEIRDIAIVRFAEGRWTEPKLVHGDGWEIQGCPVNGPSVAADRRRVAVAWFTAAGDLPRVKIAFSEDAGASFGQAISVDDGSPVGRVEVLMLADGSALVVWLERAEKGAEVRARRIRPDGSRGKAIVVAQASEARSSGFPQIARSGNEIIFAWTETSAPSRVRTASLDLADYK